MTMTDHFHAMLAVVAGAMLLAFVRLARGPSLADRVVALDTITMIAVVFAAIGAMAYGDPWPLDVAIVIALVAFLSTAAFTRFLAAQGRHRR